MRVVVFVSRVGQLAVAKREGEGDVRVAGGWSEGVGSVLQIKGISISSQLSCSLSVRDLIRRTPCNG